MENKTKPQPSLLARYLPILAWLPKYERTWLRTDLIAGLTVVALLIPEGMAYAQIAGVPPQTAFYAAPIGLLAFAIFGTSRQLVVAVSAIIATMSFATVSLIAAPDTPEFILLTAALAVLAGLISILAGLLKLGRVAQFFSESVMVGFITGLALTVMVKQVPKLLGIEGGHGNFWERLYDIIIHLPETHLATLITGVLCLILLVALEHYFHKIPAALVALVFGIAHFGHVRAGSARRRDDRRHPGRAGAATMAGGRPAELVAAASRRPGPGAGQLRRSHRPACAVSPRPTSTRSMRIRS